MKHNLIRYDHLRLPEPWLSLVSLGLSPAMPFSSSFYDKLRPMLESRSVDWTLVTTKDVQYALAALIGERQKLRDKERRKVPLSPEEIAFMRESGIHIPLLFEGQAVKWAERGRTALFQKILKIEERLADPAKINPYDDILLKKLREQLEKLKNKQSYQMPNQSLELSAGRQEN